MAYAFFIVLLFFTHLTASSQDQKGALFFTGSFYMHPILKGNEAVYFKRLEREIQQGASFRAHRVYGQTVISDAVNRGFKNVVKLLIKSFLSGSLHVTEFLVKALEDYDPERHASGNERAQARIFEALTQLVKHARGYINNFWRSKNPFKIALERQDCQLVELLLRYGANPNGLRHRNFRPLHEAAGMGNAQLVMMLMLYGADVNGLDLFGNTVLKKLKESNRFSEITAMLVKAGAQEHVIDCERLSKILGVNVLALPRISPEQQMEILGSLDVTRLAVLCSMSGEYQEIVITALCSLGNVHEVKQQLKGLPKLNEIEISRCGIKLDNYEKLVKELSIAKSFARLLSLSRCMINAG